MDRSHPRAIKRIERLKTTRLSGTGGILLHDVPGFNSTVTKHREEAEKRMEECDAIILQKMDNFNLDLAETSVLTIADADHIKLEENICCTTQCDKAGGNREQYDKWLSDNQNEWLKVPRERYRASLCYRTFSGS
jgi:hypothetical protein